jgi:hypothetical protein
VLDVAVAIDAAASNASENSIVAVSLALWLSLISAERFIIFNSDFPSLF